MNPHSSKLQHRQTQSSEEIQSREASTHHDANSPEALLKTDLENNPVPEAVSERVKRSILSEPKPRQKWLHRFLDRVQRKSSSR